MEASPGAQPWQTGPVSAHCHRSSSLILGPSSWQGKHGLYSLFYREENRGSERFRDGQVSGGNDRTEF